MVLAGTTWYLLAAHRSRPHTYRVSRMVGAELLDQPARKPADLDVLGEWRRLRSEWQAGRPGHTVRLRVAASRSDPVVQALGLVLQGAPVIERDGPSHDLITAQVTSTRGVVGVLLCYGADVEIMEPAEVRAQMVQVAQEVITAYGDAP